MARIETALISVSDKTGLPQFARRLVRLGIGIISAGGTGRLLRENGIPFEDVAAYTGVPEILDGRIKTLHHKVLAGLLALRDLEEHRRQMAEHDIRPIDMVVVNLYPLGQVITERAPEPMQAMVNIDIGGPTLIRAGAKNYTHVAVLTSPERYDAVADELEGNDGALSEETHFTLCLEAFHHTAHYDQVVAGYLAGIHGDAPRAATKPAAPSLDLESTRVLTASAPTDEQWSELRLPCWAVAYAGRHGAAVAAAGRLLALSAGRASAPEAVAAALDSAGAGARGGVMAVDGPLADAGAVEWAVRAGVTVLALCGGDADAAVVEAADRLGFTMVFAGTPEPRQ